MHKELPSIIDSYTKSHHCIPVFLRCIDLLHCAATFMFDMALSSRFFARAPLAARRLTPFASATTRACPLPVIDRVPGRLGKHTTSFPDHPPARKPYAVMPSVDELSRPWLQLGADTRANWRHPLLGCTADEVSEFIFVRVSPIANEDDLKGLLAKAGFDV